MVSRPGLAFEVVIARDDVKVRHLERSIASRYLGEDAGTRFAAERAARPSVLVQLVPREPRIWDLAGILPD